MHLVTQLACSDQAACPLQHGVGIREHQELPPPPHRPRPPGRMSGRSSRRRSELRQPPAPSAPTARAGAPLLHLLCCLRLARPWHLHLRSPCPWRLQLLWPPPRPRRCPSLPPPSRLHAAQVPCLRPQHGPLPSQRQAQASQQTLMRRLSWLLCSSSCRWPLAGWQTCWPKGCEEGRGVNGPRRVASIAAQQPAAWILSIVDCLFVVLM